MSIRLLAPVHIAPITLEKCVTSDVDGKPAIATQCRYKYDFVVFHQIFQ